MRIGIIQPNYIPWRGYFDFIRKCDLFVLLDDVQYTTRDWRNRNLIRTGRGSTEWLTVPVKGGPRDRLIRDVQIDYDTPWRQQHLSAVAQHLGAAPHVGDVFDLLCGAFALQLNYLVSLTTLLTCNLCNYLEIDTRVVRHNHHGEGLTKTDKLLAICKAYGATSYLSGPAARGYLNVAQMNDAGMKVEWMDYSGYPEYPQQYPGFNGQVSILDLIANKGRAAPDYLRPK